MRRRPFSLIEALIALTLAALLFSTLLSTHFSLAKSRQSCESLKEKAINQLALQMVLTELFAKMTSCSMEQGTLQLSFDNGRDSDMRLSGKIKARVFSDGSLKLTLTGQEKYERTDVLLSNVGASSWSFFDPKEANWISAWTQENLPPMVRLEMTVDKKTLHFAFFPTHAEHTLPL